MQAVDRAVQQVSEDWGEGDSERLMKDLIHTQVESIRSHPQFDYDHHLDRLTNTNIWHLRTDFARAVRQQAGAGASDAAALAIESQITCYAAKLHLNKGYAITNSGRNIKKGYAPTFTQMQRFPGRVTDMARKKDLLRTSNPNSPWKDGLPRMVFVSDMGDALTQHSNEHLDWLKAEVFDPITSEDGQHHIWQWLTKRPQNMAKLSKKVGGLSQNLCAMTTLTGADEKSLGRLDKLKDVEAVCRGLSLEPMWERIPPKVLNLDGIDGVIVGGESGSPNARPFDLAWARELRDHCRKKGVAVFIKQLGRNPVENGRQLRLKDRHGGDWDEWPEDLRVREFPTQFHQYRQIPKRLTPDRLPTMKKSGKSTGQLGKPLTEFEQQRFKELDATVKRAAKSVVDASIALAEIRIGKLYRASYKTFADYCEGVHNMSRKYAYNLIASGKAAIEMSAIADNFGLTEEQIPRKEFQLRELARVKDPESRCRILAEVIEEKGEAYTAADLAERVDPVLEQSRKKRKPGPKQRMKQAREDFTRLSEIVGEVDYGSQDAEVERLLASIQKLLES